MNEKIISSPFLLQAVGVTKIFKTGGKEDISVFQGVDLSVNAGDKIAILGKSGAGKSTLLHILGGLERPTEGSVFYQEKNIFKQSENELAKFRNSAIGFVFQFHYLMLEFTALENVMIPGLLGGDSRKKSETKAKSLLERVGLGKRLSHKPGALSGGEQQRVAIARALMMNPRVLLTDEMTGNLDPITGGAIFDLVQSVQQDYQIALISVTHDESLASRYEKSFRLVDSKLVPQG